MFSSILLSLLKLFVKIKSLFIFESIIDSFLCSKYFIKFSNNDFIEDIFDVHDKFDIFILLLLLFSSRLIELEHELGVVVEVVITLV